MKHFKIIIERHLGGYVAYPVGLNGVIVGQGDTYENALADVESAIRFHIETSGPDALETDTDDDWAEASIAPTPEILPDESWDEDGDADGSR